jgi:hypothetical protein
MKATIEYPVITSGIPPKGTKRRTAVLVDTMDIDIPEYDWRDAARVMTTRRGDTEGHIYALEGSLYGAIASRARIAEQDYWKYKPDLNDHPLISHERREPYAAVAQRQDAILLDQKVAEEAGPDTWVYPPEAAKMFARGWQHFRLPPIGSVALAERDDEAVEVARDLMASAAASLVLIGGILHRVCQTPLIGLSPRTDGGVFLSIHQSPYFDTGLDRARGLWSAFRGHRLVTTPGEVDEALEMIRCAKGWDHAFATDNSQEFEVHEPYLLKSGGEEFGVLLNALELISSISTETMKPSGPRDHSEHRARVARNLARMSMDEVVMFKKLIDGLDEAAVDMDESYVDLLREALHSEMAFGDRLSARDDRLVTEATIERWDNRPIRAPERASSLGIS